LQWLCPGFRKTQVFKKPNPNPLSFWGFYCVCGLTGFSDFYLKDQLGSLLVDLAHQLSFHLDLVGSSGYYPGV